MFRAAGPRVVSSAYWLNLVIYGDCELALIAFHKTSTRRKYKQVGGQGAALLDHPLFKNAAFSFIVKPSNPICQRDRECKIYDATAAAIPQILHI